ncbi:hypothetical protein EJ06DRAFT_547880 [Trichodelitschia bisporula]|uniref:Mannosyltransferase n=1 Tax=Trichodelitschia bisporula TaxID=703511 RepID=A0A6G1I2V5_9PEZI|nr:hypothetical protein EJ06DRAFT_547880 [Trichodelitschia bisporula]
MAVMAPTSSKQPAVGNKADAPDASAFRTPQRRADLRGHRLPVVEFSIFLTANLIAASLAPIQDCDEVFNYWEPSHYLNHGYGLQTWEYSPVYGIRSWAYAGMHSAVIAIGRLLPFVTSKHAEFYFLRAILGLFCALCESQLYSAVAQRINARVAILFLIVMTTSTGTFHAAAAYLPSSFAMYTGMLGCAAFLKKRTAQGVFWFAAGAILGWPFAGALVLPFVAEELLLAYTSGQYLGTLKRLLDGGFRALALLAMQTAIDVYFYKKVLCVPWNIVAYNVFSGSGKGPNIYGTEPWHFYLRNLTLNFNVWLLLALVTAPVLLLHIFFARPSTEDAIRTVTVASPFYLWLAIFTLQPHKEERFMYPAYPFLALNAALSLHLTLSYLGGTSAVIRKIPVQLRLAVAVLFVLAAVDISFLRTVGVITAYSAPLKVYAPLHLPNMSHPGDTVCLGKEWYRFSSSYFLPNGTRAKFIKSNFDGLLPGEFSEATGLGRFPGAWLEPAGMNDENKEDMGKYTHISQCKYLVDSYMPVSSASALEPHFVLDRDNWETLACAPFLDTSRTGTLGRTLWIPDLSFIPERLQRKWVTASSKDRQCLDLAPAYCPDRLRLRQRKNPRARSPDLEKPQNGEAKSKYAMQTPGVWIPSSFKRPAAAPYPNWDLHNTKPLPYRPFRSKYFVTMGLRTMPWDEWIELDSDYPKFHALKAARITERGERCCRTAPEAFDAAIELVEELCAYLPERYPSLYRAIGRGMENLHTGEVFDIVERPMSEDPMQMAARMVQDDLAIMMEGKDGQYYLLAGAILLAGFWRLEDKWRMPLSEIHTSGDVPQFKQKLEKGMMNFFRRIRPEAPMLRNNYFIQVDDKLAWSSAIGDEDKGGVNWGTAGNDRPVEAMHFRSERQSLRRLPRSGGVVFTIRTYFHPITEISQEPYVPGRLAAAVRSWSDDVAHYRGSAVFKEQMLKYLDERHEEQLAEGLVLEKEGEYHQYPY